MAQLFQRLSPRFRVLSTENAPHRRLFTQAADLSPESLVLNSWKPCVCWKPCNIWKLEKKISFTAWFSLAAYHCQACSLWELSPNKNKACQLQVAISKRKIEEKEEEEEIYFALPSIPVTRVSNGQGGWADLVSTKDSRPPSICHHCTCTWYN